MAKAPDPKKLASDRAKAARDTAPKVLFRVTVDGETIDVDPEQIGPADDLLAVKYAGMSVTEAFIALESAGIMPAGVVALLWWIGRRKRGEQVTWQQACDQLGGFATWADRVVAEQVEVDPEA